MGKILHKIVLKGFKDWDDVHVSITRISLPYKKNLYILKREGVDTFLPILANNPLDAKRIFLSDE